LPQSENKSKNPARWQPVSVLVALIGGCKIQADRPFSAQPIGRSSISLCTPQKQRKLAEKEAD